jgi:ABC-type sugar transport system ATPase subunit
LQMACITLTKVELRDISNEYILRNVNLTVLDGELLTLLGPTGAGKTTLLDVISGLIEYEGTVLFDGKTVNDLLTSERHISYVFQDLALFPHLDVASNVAYGLKVRKKPKREIEATISELLKLMKMDHLRHRYPTSLSGGEKQRAALARALAVSPNILLLDEPFNNLDPSTRQYLRAELRRLQKKLGITTIFVTHDLGEADEVGDRIAIIINGTLQQVGTPKEVFSNPENDEVADLIGSQNVLSCSHPKFLGHGLFEVNCKGTRIVVPCEGNSVKKIAIPPRGIYIYADIPEGPRVNTYKGIILQFKHLSPSLVRARIKVGENILSAELPEDLFVHLDLAIGKEVFIKLRLKSIKTFKEAGEE